jgi:hypothetical protein
LPRKKALILSEASLYDEISRIKQGLNDLQTTLDILDEEIIGLEEEFANTQPIKHELGDEETTENINLRQKAFELDSRIEN